MWHLAGSDITIRLSFESGGVPIVPDSGTPQVIVRGADGSVLLGPDPLVVTGTFLDYVVSGTLNTPAEPTALETRFVHVYYQHNGFPRTLRHNYRLTPFIPLVCTEDTVRGHLGLTIEELEDHEIDLYEAYYTLLDKVTTLPELLTTGTSASLRANETIAIQAALLKAASLPNRIAASQDSADSSFSRLSKVDPYRLIAELEGKLQGLVASFNTSGDATPPVIFLVGTRTTDPITGA